jgi:hypothetical protein
MAMDVIDDVPINHYESLLISLLISINHPSLIDLPIKTGGFP